MMDDEILHEVGGAFLQTKVQFSGFFLATILHFKYMNMFQVSESNLKNEMIS